jgi:hypothetical protein
MKNMTLKSPFPYWGGKRKVADEIWKRFGAVANYVEPFFGSGAVLLGRPEPFSLETVNDADGLLANFWRALRADPDAVSGFADWPVNENDLHARHAWLVGVKDSLQARLEGDPDYFDAKIAGWWVWGMACWIGSGFCSGKGPWSAQEVDGARQLVRLGSNGQGVNRKLVHLGNKGHGVNRQRVHLGNKGQGVNLQRGELIEYFQQLADRLRGVRVCCGDWSRACGPSVTFNHGITGVFLDPPYADTANRNNNLYRCESKTVAHDVREWAIEQGKNKLMRICLAGYDGEHQMPDNWLVHVWNAGEGYGGQATERTGNGKRERLWFSPACLNPEPQLL